MKTSWEGQLASIEYKACVCGHFTIVHFTTSLLPNHARVRRQHVPPEQYGELNAIWKECFSFTWRHLSREEGFVSFRFFRRPHQKAQRECFLPACSTATPYTSPTPHRRRRRRRSGWTGRSSQFPQTCLYLERTLSLSAAFMAQINGGSLRR